MRALYLMRHSLTEANERHLYGGSTDSPLTERGRQIARERRGAVPECGVYVSSGMARANETLYLMTGHKADAVLPQLREMDFGAFELRGYEELKDVPEYVAWIGDETGETPCPGGETTREFRERVLAGGEELLALRADTACAVCHGGVIVNLMGAWFPGENRNFYYWQPAACRGYRIVIQDGRPASFEEV